MTFTLLVFVANLGVNDFIFAVFLTLTVKFELVVTSYFFKNFIVQFPR